MTNHNSSSLKYTAGFERVSTDPTGPINKSASVATFAAKMSSLGGGIGDMTDFSDREQLIYSKEKHD